MPLKLYIIQLFKVKVIEKMFKIQNLVDPQFFVRFYKTNLDIKTHWRLKIAKNSTVFFKCRPVLSISKKVLIFFSMVEKKVGSTCS